MVSCIEPLLSIRKMYSFNFGGTIISSSDFITTSLLSSSSGAYMVSYLLFGSKSIPVDASVLPIFDDLKSTFTGLKSGSTLNAIAY